METRERRILDPSELPTRPTIRLPRFSLPPALPRVPFVRGWTSEDGGPMAVPGALVGPTPGAMAGTMGGKEAAYGGR